MNARVIVVSTTLVAAAALGFESGRLATTPRHGTSDAGDKPAELAPVIRRPIEEATPALGPISAIAKAPLDRVVRALASATPDSLAGLAQQIEQIPERPTRSVAIATFFRVLMQINPPAAKALILDLQKDNRWIATMAVKDASPPQALRQVVELLMTYDPIEISGCSYDFLGDALQQWSANDPIAVKQFIEAHPELRSEGYYPLLVRQWAAHDPDEAKRWVEDQVERFRSSGKRTYTTEELPGGLEEAWVEGLFQYDHATALDYVVGRSGEDRNGIAASLLGICSLNLRKRLAALFFVCPPDKQADALGGVTSIADRRTYGDADDEIRSPEFVANWMLQFPPEVWSTTIGTVITEWRYKNTDTLFSWMASLPPPTQQLVVAQYDPYLPRDIVEKEFNSATQVPDAALRNRLLEQIMLKTGESRAIILAALEKAQLPFEQKLYLATLIPAERNEIAVSEEE